MVEKDSTPQFDVVRFRSRRLYPGPVQIEGIEGQMDLEGEMSWSEAMRIAKSVPQPENAQSVSSEPLNLSPIDHPFDFRVAKSFKNCNPHHSSSIEAKVGNIVGHGFEDERTHDTLDPLTREGSYDLMRAFDEDHELVGNAVLEIIRAGTRSSSGRGGGRSGKGKNAEKITGIHNMQMENAWMVIDDPLLLTRHWITYNLEGLEKRYAMYGDLERFKTDKRFKDLKDTAELLHSRRATSLHRWYGYPGWLSATGPIEVVQSIMQYNLDFFNNYGVPALLIYLAGGNVPDPEWQKFKTALQAGTGPTKQHNTVLAKFSNEDVKLMIEKLAKEEAEGFFQQMMDTLALLIVSAHRVPPLMAGIQIPGKLGANNEWINAVHAFDVLVALPEQRSLQHTLGCTLGNEKFNGGLALKGRKPFKLKRLIDQSPAFQVEMPGSVNEPAKKPGSRKDIEGSNKRPLLKHVLEVAKQFREGNKDAARAGLKKLEEEALALV